ncbi:MAG: sigma-70 family RNA polymerase sigma factor [Solirubrobacterales bacterium]|nr:sigma-70 family RNA polymerase sigma factor [Solirubrobacterales bacterium]
MSALVASLDPAEGINHRGGLPPRRRRRADRRAARALHERRPEALALVMEAYGRTLLSYLTRLLADRATAEDVLQQVLLEVWQRAPAYDPERAGLLTWVLMIAKSRAVDELRRRVPEPLDPATAAERAALDRAPGDDPERLLEQWRIAALLERLPREEASLLKLRFYDDLSQSEIADSTGISLGTVKSRMVSGMAQLRWMLEAEERSEVTG